MVTTRQRSAPVCLILLAPVFFCVWLTFFFSVVIFGDPNDGDAVGSIPAENVKVICHDGDNICDGGFIVLAPHLNVSKLLSVCYV